MVAEFLVYIPGVQLVEDKFRLVFAWSANVPVDYFHLLLVVVVSSSVTAGRWTIGEFCQADLEALNCLPALNLIRRTKLQLTTEPVFLPNACYALGFIVICVLRFLKYSKISSFVILDNFSLNLSRC